MHASINLAVAREFRESPADLRGRSKLTMPDRLTMNQDSFASSSTGTNHDFNASTGPHIGLPKNAKGHEAGPAGTPPTEDTQTQSDEAASDFQKDLIQQTRRQINHLIREISSLAKSDCTTEDFYEGFLMRTTSALASAGGAIWIREQDQTQLQLQYQINLRETCLATDETARQEHSALLDKLMDSGQPALVPPRSSHEQNETGNPTRFLIVAAPILIDREPVGLVEILQRPGSGPATQRGYLRFLTQMCSIASEFLKDRRLRQFSDQKTMWAQVEQFVRAVHSGLDPKETAFHIANEGRRLIDCDRVSVALTNGQKQKIATVSGLDTIERRAEQIKLLGRLATSVCKAEEPLWYSGESKDLPPQIETRLQHYIDKSHSRMLAVLPLYKPTRIDDEQNASKRTVATQRTGYCIGALIVEQLSDARVSQTTENRVAVVAEHGQAALSNAIEHHQIFLMPLWKQLGKLLAPFRRSNWSKTALVMGVIAAVAAGFCLTPWNFALNANGQLKPTDKVEIFARLDGTLHEILVSEDAYSVVEQGQTLATMTNNDLMVEIEQLDGELKQAQADYLKFARAAGERLDNKLDEIMMAYEQNRAQKKIEGLKLALGFKKQQAEQLNVRSPIRGQVVNWQPRRNLLGRPVSRGQNLMTVVAPDTAWEIELEVPEKRVGHLLRAENAENAQSGQHQEKAPLQVVFSLVSDPGRQFNGEIVRINRNLEVKTDDGNTATVAVRFDNQQVPHDLLRAGTRVRAKIQCGTRSLGYVLFHELVETTRSNMAWWF